MKIFRLGICLVMGMLSALLQAAEPVQPVRKTFRILHVMSFDSPWRWTDGQFSGFKAGLGADVQVEYKVFQMNVKRNSTPQAKAGKGAEARALIESWKPDLVYGSDDDAQDQVARYYANSKIPFVFSGVNKNPASHGLQGARNVTGVLEEEHFVESVKLLKSIVPSVRRLAIIGDTAPHWGAVIARIRASTSQLPDVAIVTIDTVENYEQFQRKVGVEYPRIADAVLYLGNYTFKDKKGETVPYQEVQKWVSLNSKLPDISFWIDRVFYGTLASVTVSEYQQGLAAGKLARAILIDGQRPDALPIKPTVLGHPVISLARAKTLGLQINSSLLLTAEVVKNYEWAEQKR